MAKKKSEKDVLIVRDEKTGEISVVAGLDADGSPKRTPAKAELRRVSGMQKQSLMRYVWVSSSMVSILVAVL